MPRIIRITDLSPEQLAEFKALIDDKLQSAVSLAELEIARLRSENAELRNQLAECREKSARRKSVQ